MLSVNTKPESSQASPAKRLELLRTEFKLGADDHTADVRFGACPLDIEKTPASYVQADSFRSDWQQALTGLSTTPALREEPTSAASVDGSPLQYKSNISPALGE